MVDTTTTLTPAAAMTSGAMTVTASAALFSAADVGRVLSIMAQAPNRIAATAYGSGTVFVSAYAGVERLYRVIVPGTTAVASLAGTTPNYDLNTPRGIGLTIIDGTATVKYLGSGKQCWGYGVITAYTDSQHVTVTVDPRGPFVSSGPSPQWKLGEFSAARGYPAAVTFHLGRTWWGGSKTKPQALWASASGDFENMTATEPDGAVLDTSAITISLDDDQVNTVRWLSSFAKGLAVGTASGEFTVSPANNLAALNANNVRGVRQTDRGSDATTPQTRASGTILFVQRGSQKLRQLEYDFGTDTFSTIDLTQLADHITGAGVVEAGFQALPDGVLWLVRSDGQLATLTYDREQKVRAWCHQVVGGTNAVVESLCVTPAPDGTSDDVTLAVARTINGATKRTIEYIRRPFRAETDVQANGFFVDCGLTYSGIPANTFSGLDHLEGQTVKILADGSVRNDWTVTGGQVFATGPAASTVHIGLPYTHRFRSLPPETQGNIGTGAGQLKRINEVTLRFLDSAGGQYGRDGSMDPLIMRTLAMPLGSPVALFTGDKRVPFPAGWDRSAQVVIEGNDPLPMTLLAMIYEIETNG